jgi:hypothetical protein
MYVILTKILGLFFRLSHAAKAAPCQAPGSAVPALQFSAFHERRMLTWSRVCNLGVTICKPAQSRQIRDREGAELRGRARNPRKLYPPPPASAGHSRRTEAAKLGLAQDSETLANQIAESILRRRAAWRPIRAKPRAKLLLPDQMAAVPVCAQGVAHETKTKSGASRLDSLPTDLHRSLKRADAGWYTPGR